MTELDLIKLFESIDINSDDHYKLPKCNTVNFFSHSKIFHLVDTLRAIKHKVIYLTTESALNRIKELKDEFCYIPPNYSDKESNVAHIHEQKVAYEVYTDILKFFNAYEKKLQSQLEVPSEQLDAISPYPIFNAETSSKVYENLRNYFSKEDQVILLKLITTNQDAAEKIVFLDNGNRLADAFKQLIKSELITGCNQKELEAWIERNFLYRKNNHASSFTKKYLNDIISTKKDLCANPIINVKKGIIEPL